MAMAIVAKGETQSDNSFSLSINSLDSSNLGHANRLWWSPLYQTKQQHDFYANLGPREATQLDFDNIQEFGLKNLINSSQASESDK